MDVQQGQKVRLYSETDHEYFYEGKIKTVEGDGIIVNFYDWIEKFSKENLGVTYEHMEPVLFVKERGDIVAEY